jgi:hypothetical protein
VTVFADDLDTMFEDFETVTVVCGASTGEAFRDQWSAEVLPGMDAGVVSEQVAITFPTSRFPGLSIGSEVTVDSVAYVVKDRRLPPDMVDGAITTALLVRAGS